MSIRQSETEHKENEDAALPVLKEGQTFETVSASLREGKTSPPKHYTEDTLLSAMETAGAEDMPEDAERQGIGTPATRAAILEKLVSAGFVERKGQRKPSLSCPPPWARRSSRCCRSSYSLPR